MKIFSFIAFATLAHDAAAFAPVQRGQRASFLNMNVEKVEQRTIKVGVIGAGRIGLVHSGSYYQGPRCYSCDHFQPNHLQGREG